MGGRGKGSQDHPPPFPFSIPGYTLAIGSTSFLLLLYFNAFFNESRRGRFFDDVNHTLLLIGTVNSLCTCSDISDSFLIKMNDVNKAIYNNFEYHD